MNLEEVKKIVDDNVRWLRWALQLQQWDIDIAFEALRPGLKGECFADPKYLSALINIDPAKVESEKDCLITLFHELLHIVISPIVNYRDSAMELASEREGKILDTAYHQMQESIICVLERIFENGIGFDIKKLIKRTKQHAESLNADDKKPKKKTGKRKTKKR